MKGSVYTDNITNLCIWITGILTVLTALAQLLQDVACAIRHWEKGLARYKVWSSPKTEEM